jgi:hypothetical protein
MWQGVQLFIGSFLKIIDGIDTGLASIAIMRSVRPEELDLNYSKSPICHQHGASQRAGDGERLAQISEADFSALSNVPGCSPR